MPGPQCQFVKRDRERCKRTTAANQAFCWQHANGLRAKWQALPRNKWIGFWIGVLGLFATIVFGIIELFPRTPAHTILQSFGNNSPIIVNNQGSVSIEESGKTSPGALQRAGRAIKGKVGSQAGQTKEGSGNPPKEDEVAKTHDVQSATITPTQATCRNEFEDVTADYDRFADSPTLPQETRSSLKDAQTQTTIHIKLVSLARQTIAAENGRLTSGQVESAVSDRLAKWRPDLSGLPIHVALKENCGPFCAKGFDLQGAVWNGGSFSGNSVTAVTVGPCQVPYDLSHSNMTGTKVDNNRANIVPATPQAPGKP